MQKQALLSVKAAETPRLFQSDDVIPATAAGTQSTVSQRNSGRWNKPATSSLGIGGSSTLSADVASTYVCHDPGLVLLRRDLQFAELAAAWETLPAAFRSGILAMVQAGAGDTR